MIAYYLAYTHTLFMSNKSKPQHFCHLPHVNMLSTPLNNHEVEEGSVPLFHPHRDSVDVYYH